MIKTKSVVHLETIFNTVGFKFCRIDEKESIIFKKEGTGFPVYALYSLQKKLITYVASDGQTIELDEPTLTAHLKALNLFDEMQKELYNDIQKIEERYHCVFSEVNGNIIVNFDDNHMEIIFDPKHKVFSMHFMRMTDDAIEVINFLRKRFL